MQQTKLMHLQTHPNLFKQHLHQKFNHPFQHNLKEVQKQLQYKQHHMFQQLQVSQMQHQK